MLGAQRTIATQVSVPRETKLSPGQVVNKRADIATGPVIELSNMPGQSVNRPITHQQYMLATLDISHLALILISLLPISVNLLPAFSCLCRGLANFGIF